MAFIKPPCPPECPDRQAGCQGKCEKYKAYRARLDEDARLRNEAKEKNRYWTEKRVKTLIRREKKEHKKMTGGLHG